MTDNTKETTAPLNLRAVEAQLRRAGDHAHLGGPCLLCSTEALLAHCRALRAALEQLLMTMPKKRDPGSFYDQALHEAAAVLAQATDQEGT